jgi:ribosomal protein S18 acetylase RimI-like enzyme
MESVPTFWQPRWSNNTLAKAIDSSDKLAFVWEEGFKILGFACAHDVGFRAYLSELVVAQQARNKGIGKQLVHTIEKEVTQRGNAILIADVGTPPCRSIVRSGGNRRMLSF